MNKSGDQSGALLTGVQAPDGSTDCHGLDTPERVRFYEHDFYPLSNFSAFNLAFNGGLYPTSEHAYQAQKFRGDGPLKDASHIHFYIYTAASAHEAFKMAERFKGHRRPDWDAVKVGIMRDILHAKVKQHEYVRRKLLATGNRELVEDSWRDDFWGWGPNRDGQNMLGKLWMEVRAELRPPAAAVNHEAPEPNIPKGSGVQPPDGSTERALTFAKIIQTAGACGLAHNHGQGGQWLLCATVRQLIAFAEALRAEPLSMSMFATRADYQAAKESKEHLSEQPSVDRCVPLDRGPQFPGIYGAEPSVRMLIHSYYERNFKTAQANRYAMQYIDMVSFFAAVNQKDSEPDHPKESGVREALARLVALHNIKEKYARFTPDSPRHPMFDQYLADVNNFHERWEAAMEAARSALALHSGEEI